MSIIDGILAGQQALNQFRQAQTLKAQLPFVSGLAAADLDTKQTNNNYLDQKDQLANDNSQLLNSYQGLINQRYPSLSDATIAQGIASANNLNSDAFKNNTMTPLSAREQEIKNQYLPAMQQATIDNYKAQANLRNMGGANGSVNQKDIQSLQRQIQIEHPDLDPTQANQWASSYISGSTQLPDGTALPPASGIINDQIIAINNRKSSTATRNTATNMDILAQDMKNVDISPVLKFAGIKGALDYKSQAARSALGLPVTQDFRDYENFKTVTLNYIKDSIRKAFGTSVVPGYVDKIVGPLADPNSKIWYDPQQVAQQFKAATDLISQNANMYKLKSAGGSNAPLGSIGSKSDKVIDVLPQNRAVSPASNRHLVFNQSTGQLEPQ